MKRNNLVVALACLLASSMAFAQSTSTTLEAEVEAQEVAGSHKLSVDIIPLLASGIGASYEYAVSKNITVGPRGRFFTFDADRLDTGNQTEKEELSFREYGIRAYYYFTDQGESSLYTHAGYAQSEVEYEAKISALSPEGKAEDDSSGLEIGLGYQFLGRKMTGGQRFIARGGLMYGPGNEIETYINGLGEARVKQDSGLSIEGGVGFIF